MQCSKWSWCLIPSALLAACASDAVIEEGGSDEVRGGAYRYILGHDYASGRSITGGAHKVVVPTDERGKAESIDEPNKPSRLHNALKAEYLKYDATRTSGKTDWQVFASNWWPQSQNGTAHRWQPGANQDHNNLADKDRLGPLEKYDLLAYPNQPKQVAAVEHCEYGDFVANGDTCTKIKRPALTVAGPATQWELLNQGQYQAYDPESWWGHCNGWASYATAEPGSFPKRDVRVKLVAGKVTECATATEAGCVLFKMGDIEALMTELYFSDQATFSGRRCNTLPDKIERDEFGRPKDVNCRDLNAGSLHVAMVGLLNRGAKNLVTNEDNKKPAFVIDHNMDNQVWNFPLVEYNIRSQKEVTREQAVTLVGATGSTYQFNPLAAKFVEVRSTYKMVSDSVPMFELMKRADLRSIPLHPVDLNYVLELDSTGAILGGEWIQDPGTSWGENSKMLHPDFMWMAINPVGFGENADDTGGGDDNPFVSYPIVRAILNCANDATTCSAGGGGGGGGGGTAGGLCEDKCGQGPFTENGGSCFCDALCLQYNDCCTGYADACSAPQPEPQPEPEPEPAAASCAGHCGQNTAVPGSSPACYCDAACKNYGDCCADIADVCTP